MKTNIVEQAVAEFARRRGLEAKRGAQKELARECGVVRQTIRNWCRNGSIPLQHVKTVSDLTGVPAAYLNKDAWKVFSNPAQ